MLWEIPQQSAVEQQVHIFKFFSSSFQPSNKYEIIIIFKCYLLYFSFFYIFWDWAWEAMNAELPPLTKTINTGYVETYINECVSVTDWCYSSMYILHF